MSSIRIALAPGDGIGPEIVNATLELFKQAGVMKQGVEFVPVEMGYSVFTAGNSRGMTDEAVRIVEESGLLFKGPMETPKGGGGKSINVTARKLWNAYANLRVFKTLPGVESVYSKAGIPIDMVVVRENLEDTYGGVEHRLSADMIQCKRLMSAPDIAGKGIANPTSIILSGLMMLRHIHLGREAAVIENALLATLESGVHTGDFGDKGRAALGTKEFTQTIINNLGSQPKTVAAAAVPAQTPAKLDRPPKPQTQLLIRTFKNVVTQVVGCDIYLDSIAQPIAIAEEMQKIAQETPFKLTIISNRGTQVWPTGSVYTECVDYYRVRFELKDPALAGSIGQSRTVALMDRIAEKFTVCSYELLRTFDGIKGYSLAQGQ